MTGHKHNFRLSMISTKEVTHSCNCGERTSRKTTKKEEKYLLKRMLPDNMKKGGIHYIYHKFMKYFTDDGGDKNPRTWNTERLFDEAEEWAKKYPEHIRIISVDDSYHASSDVILIEHKGTNKYMGTTMLFVPQCTGESPIEIFLYPGSTITLMKALKEIRSQARPIEKAQVIADKKYWDNMNKMIQP